MTAVKGKVYHELVSLTTIQSMSFTEPITTILTTATAKAFATTGPAGLNVVPVSLIKVNTDTVWLFDFFMDKTKQNLQAEPTVSLVAWREMTGIQLKANASYHTTGPDFEAAVAWVKTQNPDRVVQGLIVLTPTALFDISPGGAVSESDLSM